MTNSTHTISSFEKSRKILLRIAVTFFCLFFVFFLSLKIYLTTHFPAQQISRLLTSYLHQTVAVSALRTTGGTLYLQGLTLANPDGFPAGNLVTADSIAIAPQWGKFLLGRQGFRLISLEGFKLDIRKNSKGAWNYAGLQQAFAGKKPASGETFIKQLSIKNGSFQINGQGAREISLQIFNLATLGSADSKIELAFEDADRNHYALSGKARTGKEPGFDLALNAPSLSLTTLSRLLPLKNTAILKEGRANLQVNAGLQEGLLRVTGSLGFNGISLPIAKKTLPLSGILNIKADYNLHNDQARIETLNLSVNHLLKLYLTGTVHHLRRERNFSASIDMNEVNLATLAYALPEKEQRRLILGGTLGNTEVKLTGNAAQGITSATGTLLLRGGSLIRDGRTFVSGLNSTVRLARETAGISVNGRLSLGKQHGKALLEAIDASFTVNLSNRLKVLSAECPSLSANVMGIPVEGRLGFKSTAANPFSAAFKIPTTKVSALQPLIDRFDLRLSSGTGSLSMVASGQGPQDFSASATVQLAALQGQQGKATFAMKRGIADTRMSWRNRNLSAAGNVNFSGLTMAGKTGEARFAFNIVDGIAVLDNGKFRLDKTSATIARLAARIPVQESRQGTVRYPLFLEFDGADILQGEMMLSGLSGSVRGVYAASPDTRWLEGRADAASPLVSWQGKPVGSPAVHISFSQSGAKANLSGPLLGGELLGDISFNPFTLEEGGRFTLGVKKIQLARAGTFIPKQKSVTIAEGLLDGSLRGAYTRQKGLDCIFETRGNAITLSNNANKILLAGAGVRLTGKLSGDTVAIHEALFTAGEGVALTAKGEITSVLSPQRKGVLSFELPQTSFNSIIEPFINILPRIIQEATVDGSLAATGIVELHDNKKVLNGALAFKDGRLEVPSQKISAVDINGNLPFSLDLSGGTALQADKESSFTKENYPRLLKQLSQQPAGGQSVSVGKISFGPLELGALTLHVKAENGITEITSLRSSFMEGDVLGRGIVSVNEGITYRGDLLIHDLSLIRLCNSFPAIKGYVSGRLDGVISLYGTQKGLDGVAGFTELWAREGSGEKMLVSKEFLQRMSGKKLQGFFFRSDRPYDRAEINAILEKGYLAFETLDIMHTNIFGVRDLSVSIAPSQNSIALDHLLNTIKQAADRGKAATNGDTPAEAPSAPEFKWQE